MTTNMKFLVLVVVGGGSGALGRAGGGLDARLKGFVFVRRAPGMAV